MSRPPLSTLERTRVTWSSGVLRPTYQTRTSIPDSNALSSRAGIVLPHALEAMLVESMGSVSVETLPKHGGCLLESEARARVRMEIARHPRAKPSIVAPCLKQPGSSMANAVELRRIHKTFDHFTAVDHLSLNIRAGSVYGLLGPNGAGKTSSIRMMIGITMPDDGEVWLFGERFHREQLQRVGYLPEERGLYKRMKVLDHLIFLGRLHGLPEPESRKRSLAWCERLQLNEWTHKKVEELSKGMQQKVQFIAALLHDPDLVIMDEPFAGLDPGNAVMLKDVLLELKKDGKTILFSTH